MPRSETVCNFQEHNELPEQELTIQGSLSAMPEVTDTYQGRERAAAVVAAQVGRTGVGEVIPFGHDVMTPYPHTREPQAAKNPPQPKPTEKMTGYMVGKDFIVTDTEKID